jgi:hypothetical protein
VSSSSNLRQLTEAVIAAIGVVHLFKLYVLNCIAEKKSFLPHSPLWLYPAPKTIQQGSRTPSLLHKLLEYAIMPAKSRFTKLDAFTKTVDEARVRTTSGGIVTIASLLIVLYLVWGEWADYRRIVIHPELIVDKGRGMCYKSLYMDTMLTWASYVGEKMEIHLNITFPRIPCELLTLDVMDVSGEQQTGVVHGVSKVRLGPASEGGAVIDIKALDL